MTRKQYLLHKAFADICEDLQRDGYRFVGSMGTTKRHYLHSNGNRVFVLCDDVSVKVIKNRRIVSIYAPPG